MKKAIAVIFLVLLFDQWLKIWIKTTFYLDQEQLVFGEWFRLHFTENPGMAFGIELGGEGSQWGKMVLRVFRIIATIAITWYLIKLIKRNAPSGLIISISLILAGAAGNLIDNAFYGMMFSDSYVVPATFMPEEGGYAGFLQGDVVDMFYFPIFRDVPIPEWIPYFGGGEFTFFSPIFNLADSAITVGVFILLFNQKKYFGKPVEPNKENTSENNSTPSEEINSSSPEINTDPIA